MKKLLILLLVCSLVSCKKENASDVFIRILNQTSQKLESVRIGSTEYGNLPVGSQSEYLRMNEAVYSPYCRFTLNGMDLNVGFFICFTPQPEPLKNGNYTFIVKEVGSGFELEVR